MLSFSDFYLLLKDLANLAKKSKNQEMMSLAMHLQDKFLTLRENNDNLKNENKELKEKIKFLEESKVKEEELIYNPKGFVIVRDEKPIIPYCSCCWKKEHKLIPLSQSSSWFKYKCGNCKTDVIVMNEDGNDLNMPKKEKT